MTHPVQSPGGSTQAPRPELRDSGGGPEDDVRRAVAGDVESFDRLVRRYQDDAVSTAYFFLGHYEDAVDVAQESFLKAYRGMAGFRGGASFRTWLLTITLNTARSLRSRMRAKKRSARVVSIDAPRCSGDPSDPSTQGLDLPDETTSGDPRELLERKELKEAIEKGLTEIEEPARQLVVLRDIAGESYEDIATSMNLPVGTVKSRVHRARKALQAKLAPLL